MENKNKKILAGTAAAAAAIALIWAVQAQKPAEKQSGQERKIKVEVVHQDGSTSSREYTTQDELLGELLSKEGLISGEEGSFGLFVTEVDGETVDYEKDGSWWKLSVDGEDAQTGVDSVPVEDGAVYTWTYMTGQ